MAGYLAIIGMNVKACYELQLINRRTFPKTVNTINGDSSTSLLFDLLPINVVDSFPPFGPKAFPANVIFF